MLGWLCALACVANQGGAIAGQPPALPGFAEQLRRAGAIQAAVRIRFSSPAASTSPLYRIWQAGAVQLASATDGRVQMHQFHAGTLHGAQNGFRAVEWGISDLATCYVSSNPQKFLLSSVWSLPFVSPEDPTIGSHLANEVVHRFGRSEFHEHGVELGHRILTAPANLYTRAAVTRLEELRGRRIAAFGNDLKTIEALGAIPVALQFTDFYFALQRGLVEGVLWNDAGVLAYRIHEVARHRLDLRIASAPIDYCISPDFLASAPRGFREIFARYNALMALAEPYFSYSSRRLQIEEGLRAAHVQTHSLADAELARWRLATRPVIEQWLRDTDAQGKPGLQLLEEIARLKDRYRKVSPAVLMDAALEGELPLGPERKTAQ